MGVLGKKESSETQNTINARLNMDGFFIESITIGNNILYLEPVSLKESTRELSYVYMINLTKKIKGEKQSAGLQIKVIYEANEGIIDCVLINTNTPQIKTPFTEETPFVEETPLNLSKEDKELLSNINKHLKTANDHANIIIATKQKLKNNLRPKFNGRELLKIIKENQRKGLDNKTLHTILNNWNKIKENEELLKLITTYIVDKFKELYPKKVKNPSSVEIKILRDGISGDKYFALINSNGDFIKNDANELLMLSLDNKISDIENEKITYESVIEQFNEHGYMAFKEKDFNPYFEYLFANFNRLNREQKAKINKKAILFFKKDNPLVNIPDNAFLFKNLNENKGRSILWLMSYYGDELRYVKGSGTDNKGNPYYLGISFPEQN